ncbi:hypothetical protein LTR05_006631 [Lithohypha guttulata]|uniref:Uncharacterized protein n=1 Tax=Lithohypha guttulata TaxID=1690604 RepID=A0AAN7SWN6_9EURO|nr:hypothetical protein LTR05_006631 [Lithohypha guttulata]
MASQLMTSTKCYLTQINDEEFELPLEPIHPDLGGPTPEWPPGPGSECKSSTTSYQSQYREFRRRDVAAYHTYWMERLEEEEEEELRQHYKNLSREREKEQKEREKQETVQEEHSEDEGNDDE